MANAAFSPDSASVGFVFIDTFILSKNFPFANITKMHWDNLRDTVSVAVNIFDWVIVVGDSAALSSSASNRFLTNTLRPFLKEHNVDVYLSGNVENMEAIEVRNIRGKLLSNSLLFLFFTRMAHLRISTAGHPQGAGVQQGRPEAPWLW